MNNIIRYKSRITFWEEGILSQCDWHNFIFEYLIIIILLILSFLLPYVFLFVYPVTYDNIIQHFIANLNKHGDFFICERITKSQVETSTSKWVRMDEQT